MNSNKRGFTITEILAVIVILAIILALVFPAVTNSSNKSKISLRESKIKTVVSAGEKYGNTSINKYQYCTNGASPSELKRNCSVPISELINNGYILEDKNNSIIDPKTNAPLSGRILFCYNPSKISIYASYVEDEKDYFCNAVDLSSGVSLSLTAVEGSGYVGGDPIEVYITKSGIFKNLTCSSENNGLATCQVTEMGSKILIKITSNEFTEPYKEVKLKVRGEHAKGVLEQTYSLIIYSPSLSVDLGENTNQCMNKGSSIQVGIRGDKIGNLSIESSDESILTGNINQNILTVISKNNTGLATVTLKESNGNRTAPISKRVFSLKPQDEIPDGMLVGNEIKIDIDYGGNDSIKIESDNPDIIKFKGKNGEETNSLTLSTENYFIIKANKKGTAKLIITGNPCGRLEYTIEVSNLYTKSHEANLFAGGKPWSTDIVSNQGDSFNCISDNPNIVECSIDGTTVTLTPKDKTTPEGGLTISIYGSNGGFDTIKAYVVETDLNLVDDQNYLINKVYREVSTPNNIINDKLDSFITYKGKNIGNVTIDSIQDENLAIANIEEEKIHLEPRSLDSLEGITGNYIQGVNTGITRITIKEDNGNKKAWLDYQIFKFDIESSEVSLIADEEKRFKITTFATGNISAVIDDASIASISVENPSNYDYGLNAANDSYIVIKAKSVGETTVTVRGADCGEVSFKIIVKSQSFTINFEKGSYVDNIVQENVLIESLSCETVGAEDSCSITFPHIGVSGEFDVIGFSTNKDSLTKEYEEGQTLIVNKNNNGTTYYANAKDVKAPVCELQLTSYIGLTAGKVEDITIMCNESGSGSASKLTKDSFVFSDNTKGEITYVDDPIEIVDDYGLAGYKVKIGLLSENIGNEFNLTLKENAFVDKFGNGNEELDFGTLFTAEYKAYKHWYIGKENEEDILAIQYINKYVPEEIKGESADDMYTLILYGKGETKDFYSGEEGESTPWVTEGFQEFITKVIVKDGITNIGNSLFYAIYNLENVILPEGITSLGETSFAFTEKLKEITIPTTVKSIKDRAFESSGLEKLTLNKGLESIGMAAFNYNPIKELFIPNTVTTIGNHAFANESESMTLERLEFENGSKLKTISKHAFENHKLKTLTIPDSVTTIDLDAFSVDDYSSSTLKTLTFGTNSRIINIFENAFYNNKISNMNLPNTLSIIGENAFNGVDLNTFRIGPKVYKLDIFFAAGNNLREYIVDESNPYFKSIDGVVYTKNLDTLIRFPDNYHANHNNLNIPEGVKTIKAGAFGGWLKSKETLKQFEINFPSSITEMNLKGLNMVSNFVGTYISAYNIDSANYKSVDGVLFSKDLQTVYRLPSYYSKNSYTIPSTTNYIEEYFAFSNYSVKTLNVPNSIRFINNYAFAADPNIALTNIYLNIDASTELKNTFLLNFHSTASDTFIKNVYVKDEGIKMILSIMFEDSINELNIVVGG